ncbi:MAG: amino acid adenylation domain-containing protein, partial [Candidatus Aminicenantes bacterium]
MEQLGGYDNLDEIKPLTAEEKQKILIEWNNTAAEYPKDKCIHELFQEQVRKTPGEVAVVFADQTLTYRELDERSNKSAAYLQKQGVKPDSLVGMCLERSLELIVGILGILKAGGAYLPIDPDYPQERIDYILADGNARVLLTTAKLQVKVKTDLFSASEPPFSTLTSTSTCKVSPANLAYVIYTSGSTGRPKGVMVVHYSVNRLVLNTNYLQISGEDTFLQYAPISFDAATLEIWGPLLNGAKLSMAPTGRLSLTDLKDFIEKQKVTTAWLTAPLFQSMVEEKINFFKSIKTILAGGDVLPAHAVKKLSKKYGQLQIINGYGPTENTTFTCCYRVNRKKLPGYQKIPIGVPISNTACFILDEQLKPVPTGVYGELYTGGDGLARGYLNQPELTNDKFLIINYKLKTEEARQLHELTQIKPTSNQKLLRGVPGGGFLE